jgi:hypothetical protein
MNGGSDAWSDPAQGSYVSESYASFVAAVVRPCAPPMPWEILWLMCATASMHRRVRRRVLQRAPLQVAAGPSIPMPDG